MVGARRPPARRDRAVSRRRRELDEERRPVGFVRAPDGRTWLVYAVDLGPLEGVREELEPVEGEPPADLPDLSDRYDVAADGKPFPKLGLAAPLVLGADPDAARRDYMRGMIADLLAELAQAALAAADPVAFDGHPARQLAADGAELARLARKLGVARELDCNDVYLALLAVNWCSYELGRLELLSPAGVGHRVRRGSAKGAAIANGAAPPPAARIGAWKAELARIRRPDGRLPRGAVSRAAEALAEQFGTSPSTERKFAYEHRAEIGI